MQGCFEVSKALQMKKTTDDILSPNAIPRPEVERLKSLTAVVGERGVS
jgi:hypothetical protein